MVRVSSQMRLAQHYSHGGGVGSVVVLVFTVLGLAVAALMMYIGWQHNSQGEFYDETGVHWGYWLFLGFSWFIVITGIPYAVAVAVLIRRFLIRSRDARSTPTA
jgi:hypothetical protein